MNLHLVHFLTIASLGSVLSQRHRDGCLNSAVQLAPVTEDSSVGSGRKCYQLHVHYTSRNQQFHISVVWDRSNSICRSSPPRVIEIMGRGSIDVSAYRYPMGAIEFDQTDFCQNSDTSKYHKDFQSYSSTVLSLTKNLCDPTEVHDPSVPNLYVKKLGTQFAVFKWLSDYPLTPINSLDDEIVACVSWIFQGDPHYSDYILDYTAEITFGDPRSNTFKFVQVGRKQISLSLKPTTNPCRRTDADSLGIATFAVKEQVFVSGMRPDNGSLATVGTTTTMKPVHPEPVTNPIEIISGRFKRTKSPTELTTNSNTNTGKEEVFEGCLFTKKCLTNFGDKEECLATKSCEIVVSLGGGKNAVPDSDEAVLELYGTTTGWVAMGISRDKKMGDDLVIECVREHGKVNIYLSWNFYSNVCNLGHNQNLCNNNRRLTGSNSGEGVVRLISSSAFENTIYCRFYLKLEFQRQSPLKSSSKPSEKFNLSTRRYNVLIAQGEQIRSFGPTGNIGMHFLENVRVSQEKVNIAERWSPYPHQVTYLKAHGIFMMLAWLFCIPVGSFIARYFKDTFVQSRLYGIPSWKFIHAAFMVAALLFIVAGTILYIIGKHGWKGQRSNFHSYGGIICITAFLILAISGVWVKERVPGAKARNTFNISHGIVGHASYLISCGLFIEAPKVYYSELPCRFRWNMILWLLSYFIMHIVMSYHYCWVDYIVGVSARAYGLTSATVLVQEVLSEESIQQNLSLRRVTPIADFGIHPQGTLSNFANQPRRDRAERVENPGHTVRIVAVGVFTVVNLVFLFLLLRGTTTDVICYNTEDYIQIYMTQSN